MNYDQLNQVHDYWRHNIFPHLSHKFTAMSFDDYMKKFSFTPSGKWIRDLDSVKMGRVLFAVTPIELVTKYKKHCVTYISPMKPEDGLQRVIYQMSPTLHFEAAFWVWIEHKIVNSYGMIFSYYHDEKEFLEFTDELYKIRRNGNTEDKIRAGFAQPLIPTTGIA